MHGQIELGYEIELESRPPSEHSSAVTEPYDKRTSDWLSNLPSRPDSPSQNHPKPDSSKNDQSRWPELPPSLIRGSPSRFQAQGGKWTLIKKAGLRNDLLFAVGFLELANACDFAANVFNDTPVAIYAAVLMALGGTIALIMLAFAVWDARLSLANLRLLRAERRRLQQQLRQSHDDESYSRELAISIQACLAVNLRELGFEFVDRFLLDIIMGFGCLLVGIGTLMAIGGNKRSIYLDSNLLSGYIGNAPAAVYGLCSLFWSLFVYFRVDTHSKMSRNDVAVGLIAHRLAQRHDTIKLHAVVYGLTGIVSGAGALMTATLWYGYVMLIPCILASGWCNWLWRTRAGYGRPMYEAAPILSRDALVAEIRAVAIVQKSIKTVADAEFDEDSMLFMLEILKRYNLMDDFCEKLSRLNLPSYEVLLGEARHSIKEIDTADILTLEPLHRQEIYDQLKKFMSKRSRQALIDRERYFLELLGSYFFAVDTNPMAM